MRAILRRYLTTTGALLRGAQAALLRERGQALQLEKVQRQPLKSKEVDIRVKYCSLNSNDVRFLEGDKLSYPFIPGYELSGEITEVGKDVKTFGSGERVVAVVPERSGGLASQIALNMDDVWKLPSELSSKEAAALVVGHATALLAFSKFKPLNEGDVILVIAGAGGFGLAAVDVAASIFKAKVIAITDTEGKGSLLRERGAFAAFKNNLKVNFKEIMSATDNKGVDLIYDAVGGSILNTVIKCLKDPEEGVVLTTYRSDDDDKDCDENDDDSKSALSEEVIDKIKTVSLTDLRNEDQDEYYNLIEQILQFCEDGLISAHISKNFKLEEINEAIDYIKGKMCTGKVVIHVDN